MNNFEIINERISSFELLKGRKFGEYTYFGEFDSNHMREGYGTLYDAYGIMFIFYFEVASFILVYGTKISTIIEASFFSTISLRVLSQ